MKQKAYKLLSFLLATVMLVSLLPTTALAADTINIKGITAPVAGEAPVNTGITTDTAGITLTNIQWQKGSSVLNSTNKFEAGQTYNLWIRYAVSEGYEISDAVTVTSDLENSTNDIDTARRIVHIWYTVPAAPKYTVTVTGGGTVEGKDSVTTEAGTRLQLRAPEVSGKRFTGWSGLDGITFYGDNAKVTDPILQFIMPAKNLTVTANYQDAVEITTVNIKGITKPLAGANPVNFGVTTDTTGLSVKEVIWYFDRTPSTNVPHDYEFQLGDKLYLLVWLDVADGYTLANPLTITADLEYTAAYRGLTYGTVYIEYTVTEEMPTTYTVSFDANGGTGTMADKTGISGEYTLPANEFTAPDGKQFKAWSVGGVEKAAHEKITVTANTTVTALWEDIPVAPKTLDSIAITTPPTKTAYTAGESFDSTGMVVTATYSDSSTAPVTGYTVAPDGVLGMSNTEITVTYNEDGVIKTATQPITVTSAGGSGSGDSGSDDSGSDDTSTVTPSTPSVPEYVNPFTDVSEGDYFYDAVKWAVTDNVTTGTTDTTFSPDMVCSRAQAVTFLYRAAGSPDAKGEMPFSDVAEDAYYHDAVLWAIEKGITKGISETEFAPDAVCTREQIVTFLYRTAISLGKDVSVGEDTNILSYDDAFDIGEWAIPAMQWACGAGVMNGTSESTLSPQMECTRGQIVTFLYRAFAE